MLEEAASWWNALWSYLKAVFLQWYGGLALLTKGAAVASKVHPPLQPYLGVFEELEDPLPLGLFILANVAAWRSHTKGSSSGGSVKTRGIRVRTQQSQPGGGPMHPGFHYLHAQIEMVRQPRGFFPAIEVDGLPFSVKSCSLREDRSDGSSWANQFPHGSTSRPTAFLVWTPPGTKGASLSVTIASKEPRSITRVYFEKCERAPKLFKPKHSVKILRIDSIDGVPQDHATFTIVPPTDSERQGS